MVSEVSMVKNSLMGHWTNPAGGENVNKSINIFAARVSLDERKYTVVETGNINCALVLRLGKLIVLLLECFHFLRLDLYVFLCMDEICHVDWV